jgi:hypothetical protein
MGSDEPLRFTYTLHESLMQISVERDAQIDIVLEQITIIPYTIRWIEKCY